MAEGPDTREKPLEELEKEITCAVCHGFYQKAKLLPCNHLVSFPDPFCARARNLKLGGGERPGKGSGKSSRQRSECWSG